VKKDIAKIPKGYYCYTRLKNGKIKCCPYWKRIKDRPEQYDGWCDYLEKGDIELAKECDIKNCKTGKICKGSEVQFPVSLLWDMCKMCMLKEEEG